MLLSEQLGIPVGALEISQLKFKRVSILNLKLIPKDLLRRSVHFSGAIEQGGSKGENARVLVKLMYRILRIDKKPTNGPVRRTPAKVQKEGPAPPVELKSQDWTDPV